MLLACHRHVPAHLQTHDTWLLFALVPGLLPLCTSTACLLLFDPMRPFVFPEGVNCCYMYDKYRPQLLLMLSSIRGWTSALGLSSTPVSFEQTK